jgi:hypothetical protein
MNAAVAGVLERELMTPTAARRRTWAVPFWLWFPLSVYLATRLYSVVIVLAAAHDQIAVPAGAFGYHVVVPSEASPGYGVVLTNWDAQWYTEIATRGYPAVLPRDASGAVLQNEWAFFPLFPLTAGALMRLTGLGFQTVGPALAVVLGAGAMVVMFRLVQAAVGRFGACVAVVLSCTYMTATVLQAAYTESLALLLICTSLLLLHRRRYGPCVVPILLLALTRNIVLAMAAVVVLHGLWRWHRERQQLARSQRLQLAGLAGVCVAAAGLWPAIAWLGTGEPGAYPQTMAAWTEGLKVVTAWPAALWEAGGWVGVGLLLGAGAMLVHVLFRPASRRWGPELWGWAAAYPAYVVLATVPGPSSLRYFQLAFPLALPLAEPLTSPRERPMRLALVGAAAGAGLLLQWYWVQHFLAITRPLKGSLFP